MRLPSSDHFGTARAHAGLREATESAAVRTNDVDAELLHVLPTGAVAVAEPLGVPVGGEGDPLSIGRPGGTEERVRLGESPWIAGARQVAELPGREIEDPHVRPVRVARGDERESLSIGREHALIVERGAVRQPLQSGAVGMHAIDVRLSEAVALGGEDDPLAVRRVGRVVVEAGGRQQRRARRSRRRWRRRASTRTVRSGSSA